VAIIGAGLTGAMVAYELSHAGLDCLLLDRRAPGAGSTAASTALLLYELDEPLHVLERKVGHADAARCYRLGVIAIDQMERLCALLPKGCDFVRRHSLYVASTDEDARLLKRELAARQRHRFDTQFLSRDDVAGRYSFTAAAALLSEGAQVNGYRLAGLLVQASVARGARVCSGTCAASAAATPTGFRIITTRGHAVTARRVVLATGYETADLFKVKGRLVSTYAIATTPIDRFQGWEDRSMIWETGRPYTYIRTTADGRALVGGADEPITDPDERDRLLPKKTEQLLARFRSMFPKIKSEVDRAWAGFFIETDDGLPYIGECPDTPGLYLSLCFGANGSTFAVTAAHIIRDLLAGRPNDDARLFRLDR
jgi:glycine/D-amino acid oxidase-like deaminating enzyme